MLGDVFYFDCGIKGQVVCIECVVCWIVVFKKVFVDFIKFGLFCYIVDYDCVFDNLVYVKVISC